MITLIWAYRDIPRISSNLEYSYNIVGQRKITLSRVVAGLIYLPAFAIMVIGGWLGHDHLIGQLLFCLIWMLGPLWIFMGRLSTGDTTPLRGTIK